MTMCNHTEFINLLWPSDNIWRHRSRSTLTATSHYPKQCYLKIIGIHPGTISLKMHKICRQKYHLELRLWIYVCLSMSVGPGHIKSHQIIWWPSWEKVISFLIMDLYRTYMAYHTNSDLTWASRRLGSPTSRLFVQQLLEVTTNVNI